MRKFLSYFITILLFTPIAYEANGAISRALPTGAKQLEVARTVSMRTATRDASRAGNTADTKVRGTVSRVVASSVPKETKTYSRTGVVSRTVQTGDNGRGNVSNPVMHTVGRNERVSSASINANPSVRRAGLVLRPSTAEVGGRATIGDSGVQTGSNIDEKLRGVKSRAATVNAESIEQTKEQLSNVATLNKSCQDRYNECMDQFCAIVDQNQNRCSCSANITKYAKVEAAVKEANNQLNDVVQNIRYIGLSEDEVNAILSETEAELSLGSVSDTSGINSALEDIKDLIRNPTAGTSYTNNANAELELDFSSDGINILNVDFLNFDGNSSVTNMRGADLYNAAKNHCDMILNQCKQAGGNIEQITASYELKIDKDCIAYEEVLNNMNSALLNNVRNADKMLQKARIAVSQNENQYDAKGCVAALDSCMTDDMVCGENYSKCVDPTKKYIDENGEVILGQNVSNIRSFMTNYSGASIDSASLKDTYSNTKIKDTDCINKYDDGSCIIKHLLNKIGTKSDATQEGLCRNVLEKCKYYSYDQDDNYLPFNDVVVSYIQQAMKSINATQNNIISEYTSSCMKDVVNCYEQQVGQFSSYSSDASIKSIYNVMRGACRDIALTCAYAVFEGDTIRCPADGSNKNICINSISDMFFNSAFCEEGEIFDTETQTCIYVYKNCYQVKVDDYVISVADNKYAYASSNCTGAKIRSLPSGVIAAIKNGKFQGYKDGNKTCIDTNGYINLSACPVNKDTTWTMDYICDAGYIKNGNRSCKVEYCHTITLQHSGTKLYVHNGKVFRNSDCETGQITNITPPTPDNGAFDGYTYNDAVCIDASGKISIQKCPVSGNVTWNLQLECDETYKQNDNLCVPEKCYKIQAENIDSDEYVIFYFAPDEQQAYKTNLCAGTENKIYKIGVPGPITYGEFVGWYNHEEQLCIDKGGNLLLDECTVHDGVELTLLYECETGYEYKDKQCARPNCYKVNLEKNEYQPNLYVVWTEGYQGTFFDDACTDDYEVDKISLPYLNNASVKGYTNGEKECIDIYGYPKNKCPVTADNTTWYLNYECDTGYKKDDQTGACVLEGCWTVTLENLSEKLYVGSDGNIYADSNCTETGNGFIDIPYEKTNISNGEFKGFYDGTTRCVVHRPDLVKGEVNLDTCHVNGDTIWSFEYDCDKYYKKSNYKCEPETATIKLDKLNKTIFFRGGQYYDGANSIGILIEDASIDHAINDSTGFYSGDVKCVDYQGYIVNAPECQPADGETVTWTGRVYCEAGYEPDGYSCVRSACYTVSLDNKDPIYVIYTENYKQAFSESGCPENSEIFNVAMPEIQNYEHMYYTSDGNTQCISSLGYINLNDCSVSSDTHWELNFECADGYKKSDYNCVLNGCYKVTLQGYESFLINSNKVLDSGAFWYGSNGNYYQDSICEFEINSVDSNLSVANGTFNGWVYGGNRCIADVGTFTGNCSVSSDVTWNADFSCNSGYSKNGFACKPNVYTKTLSTGQKIYLIGGKFYSDTNGVTEISIIEDVYIDNTDSFGYYTGPNRAGTLCVDNSGVISIDDKNCTTNTDSTWYLYVKCSDTYEYDATSNTCTQPCYTIKVYDIDKTSLYATYYYKGGILYNSCTSTSELYCPDQWCDSIDYVTSINAKDSDGNTCITADSSGYLTWNNSSKCTPDENLYMYLNCTQNTTATSMSTGCQ